MKNAGNSNNKQGNQGKSNTNRPEIRDNLDSRKNEEQDVKGDDTTHNKKDVHTKPKKDK